MENSSLSSSISVCIEELEALLDNEPTNEILYEQIKALYEMLEECEGREWDAQTEQYQLAQAELENATKAAQIALDDLSKAADVITKVAYAMGKLSKVIVRVV